MGKFGLSLGSNLPGIVMDDESGVPAVEMFMCPHSSLQLLQQSAICTLSLGMHGCTHIIQHTHDTRRVLQGEYDLLRHLLIQVDLINSSGFTVY